MDVRNQTPGAQGPLLWWLCRMPGMLGGRSSSRRPPRWLAVAFPRQVCASHSVACTPEAPCRSVLCSPCLFHV